PFVENADRVFFVELPRSVVQVGRTDHGPFAVNHYKLAVNECRPILVDPGAGFQQVFIICLRTQSYKWIVDVLSGNKKPNIDTLLSLVDERLLKVFVGNEVWRHDQQALSGGQDRQEVKPRHRISVGSGRVDQMDEPLHAGS